MMYARGWVGNDISREKLLAVTFPKQRYMQGGELGTIYPDKARSCDLIILMRLSIHAIDEGVNIL